MSGGSINKSAYAEEHAKGKYWIASFRIRQILVDRFAYHINTWANSRLGIFRSLFLLALLFSSIVRYYIINIEYIYLYVLHDNDC